MAKVICGVCKGSGNCTCGGIGCPRCATRDLLTGRYFGKHKGECSYCGGKGKVEVRR